MLISRHWACRYLILITLILIPLIVFLVHRVPRLINSHLYDLSYEPYFQRQFHTYILTASCGRFTRDATLQFDPASSLTLVPNYPDTPECNALSRNQLHPQGNLAETSKDGQFKEKYAQVLDACAQGSKAKCLILEDDVVFLHEPARTREILVESTVPLFNDGDNDAFDCTKRGFGWLYTEHTGMGSQCRVYSKHSAGCMSACLRGQEKFLTSGVDSAQLDAGLPGCQIACGLRQKRFLLVVHGGLGSTMERPE
ncbi:hypothetical protein BJX76DRAFT_261528 [Aspergillus varians]